MRHFAYLPLVAVLALAACEDEQRVAETEPEAPVTSAPGDTAVTTPPPAAEETAEAPPPATMEQDTAAAPTVTETEPAPADTASAPPPPSGDTTTTTTAAPPPSTQGTQQDTASAPATGASGDQVQATGAVSGDMMIEPGRYQSQNVELMLEQDGRFTLTNPQTGDTASGDYQLEGGMLTLTSTEQTAAGQFPMNCEITEQGEGFQVNASDPSCEVLDGETFEREG